MAHQLEVHREKDESEGRYVACVDGHEAEMPHSKVGASTIVIDHTAVPGALRGRGVGEALVRCGVEDARAEGRAIMPLRQGADRPPPGVAGRPQAIAPHRFRTPSQERHTI